MANKVKYYLLTETGARIEKLRESKNVSRADLAAKIGIGEKTYRNWIQGSGKKIIDCESLKKLCKELGCSADYLLCREDGTTRDINFIMEKTGLNEQALLNLITLKEGSNNLAKYIDYMDSLLIIARKNKDNPYIVDIMANTFSIIGTCLNDTIEEKETKDLIIAGLRGKIQQAFMNFTDNYIDKCILEYKNNNM